MRYVQSLLFTLLGATLLGAGAWENDIQLLSLGLLMMAPAALYLAMGEWGI